MSLSTHLSTTDAFKWLRQSSELVFVVQPWEADSQTQNMFRGQIYDGVTLATRLMPMKLGDRIELLATSAEWGMGRLKRQDLDEICVFPLAVAQKSLVTLPNDVETLLTNVDTVLKSWLAQVSSCTDSKILSTYADVAETLLVARKSMLESVETPELHKYKREIVLEMEKGNLCILSKHIIRADDGSVQVAPPSQLWARHANSSFMQTTIDVPNIQSWSLTTEFKAIDAAVCAKGEFIELESALYDDQEQRFISEWGVCHLNENGSPLDDEKLSFVHFGPRQWGDDVYLVCRVARRGKLILGDKEAVQTVPSRGVVIANIAEDATHVRRPVSVGVVRLKDVFGPNLINATARPDVVLHQLVDEGQWSTLHDCIIRQKSFESVGTRRMMNLLHLRVNEQATGCKIPPIGFPEVPLQEPLQRNTVYLTLQSGFFPKHANVEICIQVRRNDGAALENCVFPNRRLPGSTRPWTTSLVYASNKSIVAWNETFRVEIPPQEFGKCHVFLGFRQVVRKMKPASVAGRTMPDDLFGFAFVPLMTEKTGTVLADGLRTLSVFKPAISTQQRYAFDQKLASGACANWWWYLDEECCAALQALDATLQCHTLLCSTYFTQNASLVNLIRWKHTVEASQGKLEMGLILQAFSTISETDVVSFLPEILLALCSMMEWVELQQTDKDAGYLFNTVVFVLSIVADARFPHLMPLAEKHMKQGLITPPVSHFLIEGLRRLLLQSSSAVNDAKAGKAMRSAIKVWHMLMKLATASGGVDMQAIQGVLEALEFLLSRVSPASVLGAQSLAMQHLAPLVVNMDTSLDVDAVAGLITRCLQANTHVGKRSLIKYKLDAIEELMETRFWKCQVLVVGAVEWLVADMERLLNDQEMEGWGETAVLLANFASHLYRANQDRVSTVIGAVLPGLLQLHHHSAQEDKKAVAGALLDILAGLFTTQPCLELILKHATDPNDTLFHLLSLLNDMIQTSVIPDSRVNLFFSVLSVFVSTLDPVAEHVQTLIASNASHRWSRTSHTTTSSNIVSAFLHLLLLALSHPKVSMADRVRGVVDQQLIQAMHAYKIDTLQNHCASLLQQTWESLARSPSPRPAEPRDDRNSQRISQVGLQVSMDLNLLEFVGKILRLGCLKQGRLRAVALTMTLSVAEKEWVEHRRLGNFAQSCVEEMEVMFREDLTTDWQGFWDALHQHAAGMLHHHPSLKHVWQDFMTKIQEVVSILGCLQQTQAEERSLWLVRLIQVEERLGVLGTFANSRLMCVVLVKKHLLSLADAHLRSGYGVEAGLVLSSLARRLEWGDERASIYEQSILYLERAKAWEEAAKVGHVLMQHWKSLFAHARLSALLTRMATWYGKMLEDKYSHSFFRVAFHGSGWSDVVRGQSRVFKGGEWEKIGGFCERLLLSFPGASLARGAVDSNLAGRSLAVTSVDPVTDWVTLLDHLQGEDQDYLSDANVESVERFHESWSQAQQGVGWDDPHLPSHMVQHYKNNQVRHFVSSLPIKKKQSKENEFLDLWTQRTLMTVACPLPSVVNSSNIIATTTVELSPIENALEGVRGKTAELRGLLAKFSNPDAVNINPLTMSLNGAVDAPVNGGINMYRKAFLCPNFLQAYPQWSDHVTRLSKAILLQAQVIDECLTLHGKLASEAMRPLHNSLVAQFHKNFTQEIALFSAQSNLDIRSPSVQGFHKKTRSVSSTGSLAKLAKFASKLKMSPDEPAM